MLRNALFVLVKMRLTIDRMFPTLSAYRTFSPGCSWIPNMGSPFLHALLPED
jgi:hypothetical protein